MEVMITFTQNSWIGIIKSLMDFAFYYPLFMAYLWMIGGIYYFFHWEKKNGLDHTRPPILDEYPPVSIIIPCHNEGENIRDTIEHLTNLEYPDYEIIAVNDGSTDNTAEVLDELESQIPQLRVVHFRKNQGKAVGLRTAALLSRHEFLIAIDGDAILDPYAVTWIMHHFINGPRVAAVTGNPRIRTRSTLLGKIQVGEFSAIIGLIKRAQRIYGKIFTVSGVVTGFRKSALHQVGYWSNDMVTDDIDISWKLQLDMWDIRYEPKALCWILMPETLRGLWRQRLRWAQGGAEVLIRYFKDLFNWKRRRMWPIYLELTTSLFWAYVMFIIGILWFTGLFFPLPDHLRITSLIPEWHGMVLGFTALLQFAVASLIDGRYEGKMGRNYYWMIWYPLVYWLINTITSIVGLPKALLKRRGKRAIWVSPDRGVQPR